MSDEATRETVAGDDHRVHAEVFRDFAERLTRAIRRGTGVCDRCVWGAWVTLADGRLVDGLFPAELAAVAQEYEYAMCDRTDERGERVGLRHHTFCDGCREANLKGCDCPDCTGGPTPRRDDRRGVRLARRLAERSGGAWVLYRVRRVVGDSGEWPIYSVQNETGDGTTYAGWDGLDELERDIDSGHYDV